MESGAEFVPRLVAIIFAGVIVSLLLWFLWWLLKAFAPIILWLLQVVLVLLFVESACVVAFVNHNPDKGGYLATFYISGGILALEFLITRLKKEKP